MVAKGVPGEMVERCEAAPCSLPIDHYCAVVTLSDSPRGDCQIEWGSNWVAKDAPKDSVRRMLTGLYDNIIAALLRAAK